MSLVKLTSEERDEMRGRLSKVRSAIDNNAKPEARELVNELQRDLKKLPALEGKPDPEKESGSSESTSEENEDPTVQSPSKTPEPEKQKATSGDEDKGIDAEKRSQETRKQTVKGFGEDERAEDKEPEDEVPEDSRPESGRELDAPNDDGKVSFN